MWWLQSGETWRKAMWPGDQGLARVTLGTSLWNADKRSHVHAISAKNTCSGSGHKETLDEPRLRDILWNESLAILSNSRETVKCGGAQEAWLSTWCWPGVWTPGWDRVTAQKAAAAWGLHAAVLATLGSVGKDLCLSGGYTYWAQEKKKRTGILF